MQSMYRSNALPTDEQERTESPFPKGKGLLMRAARIIVLGLGLGLAASAVGCYTCQHTAGVCDCDPPPVAYVLQPPPRPAYATVAVAPVATTRILPAVPGSPGTPLPGGEPLQTKPRPIESPKD
jgi:hypothetical protein